MIMSYRFSTFLHCICQDEVTTSSGYVTSRNKLHGNVREKIFGKVTEGILEVCYGSGVMQQKVGLGVNIPPLGSMCVNHQSSLLLSWWLYILFQNNKHSI